MVVSYYIITSRFSPNTSQSIQAFDDAFPVTNDTTAFAVILYLQARYQIIVAIYYQEDADV